MENRNAALALAAGALGIALFALKRRSRDVTADRAHHARTVTVRADALRLHELFKQPELLERVFRGTQMDVVADVPGERFEWKTHARAPFTGGGSLTFAPAPAQRGTQARLALYLEGPGARAASGFQRAFGGSIAQTAMESVRALKALAEAGEIPQAVRA